MAKDILEELAAAEYRWSPSLGDLDRRIGTQQGKDLAKFLLGGLIFSAYAQVLNGQHIVQPKRSRLLLAARAARATPPRKNCSAS